MKVLNETRRNNRIYVRLMTGAPGAVVNGEALTALPPSVLSVLEADRNGGNFSPIRSAAIGEYEIPMDLAVVGSLVGEHPPHAAHEARRDPSVRQVAEEARRTRVASRNFRPLVPRRRPLVVDQPCEERQRALLPAEAQQCDGVADLVRRVRVLHELSASARLELLPGSLHRELRVVRGVLRRRGIAEPQLHEPRLLQAELPRAGRPPRGTYSFGKPDQRLS